VAFCRLRPEPHALPVSAFDIHQRDSVQLRTFPPQNYGNLLIDTVAKRSIFLELTESLAAQGQFQNGGLFERMCPRMTGSHNRWSGFSSIVNLMDNSMPRNSSDPGNQQRWGLLTHGLTPPLATLRSDYPPLLCTLHRP
jgi:hypothetical protein